VTLHTFVPGPWPSATAPLPAPTPVPLPAPGTAPPPAHLGLNTSTYVCAFTWACTCPIPMHMCTPLPLPTLMPTRSSHWKKALLTNICLSNLWKHLVGISVGNIAAFPTVMFCHVLRVLWTGTIPLWWAGCGFVKLTSSSQTAGSL
jgi:hypothetical protein